MKKLLIVAVLLLVNISHAVAQADWRTYKTPYVGEENNIANPHRSAEEISIWAQRAVTDVLSFSKADYKTKLAGFKKYFVPQGWQLYAAYLKDSKILNMVVDEGYTLGTIATEVPEVMQHAAAGGVHHWMVRIPVTVSLFTVNPAGENVVSASRKSVLFMDIGRVAESAEIDGIAVYNWRMDDAVSVPR